MKIIKFSTKFCHPCRAVGHFLKETYGDKVTIESIDCEDEPEKAEFYKIKAVPTVIVETDTASHRFQGTTEITKANLDKVINE